MLEPAESRSQLCPLIRFDPPSVIRRAVLSRVYFQLAEVSAASGGYLFLVRSPSLADPIPFISTQWAVAYPITLAQPVSLHGVQDFNTSSLVAFVPLKLFGAESGSGKSTSRTSSAQISFYGLIQDLPHVVHYIEVFVNSLASDIRPFQTLFPWSQFGNSPDMVTDTPRYLSVITELVTSLASRWRINAYLVACIIFVFTGNRSRQPFILVEPTIKMLKQNQDFAESISSSVGEACSEFPEESQVHKLVERLVGILMEYVDGTYVVPVSVWRMVSNGFAGCVFSASARSSGGFNLQAKSAKIEKRSLGKEDKTKLQQGRLTKVPNERRIIHLIKIRVVH
ncbi:hypothetical protein B0H19DRAFT_1073542 [Mycena capillaripes]|nr:hypothetical protein B0H19DRAFT_1073542 [Mycena capillaripes]